MDKTSLILDIQEGMIMAQYVMIQRKEMVDFLEGRGFKLLSFDDIQELIYGKRVRHDLSLRIYTSIVEEGARGVGSDAIRCTLMYRDPTTKQIYPVGKNRHVHRVKGWKKNLDNRINNWEQALGPVCTQCKSLMVKRHSSKTSNGFWGCITYPNCKGTKSLDNE